MRSVRYYQLSPAGYKEASGPWLELSVSASDDSGSVYYEVLQNQQGTVTRLATAQSAGEKLRLGRFNICHASELEFPASGLFSLLVRAIDRAGHASAPAEFSIDLAHPLRKH